MTPALLALEYQKLKIHKTIMKLREQQLNQIRQQITRDELGTDELLVVALARYEQKKKDLNRASSVIPMLSAEEVNSLMPHLQNPYDMVQRCLNLAQQRDKAEMRKFRFFAIISQILRAKKKNTSQERLRYNHERL